MKLMRLVVSDLHLGTGVQSGRLNPHEDFFEDDRFAELLAHYDALAGEDTEIELILNGDIFDLLKVKIDGTWPTEITEEIATEKLRLCLEGHPKFALALRRFLSGGERRLVYLPGNHDLDMWFYAPAGAVQALRRARRAERARALHHVERHVLPARGHPDPARAPARAHPPRRLHAHGARAQRRPAGAATCPTAACGSSRCSTRPRSCATTSIASSRCGCSCSARSSSTRASRCASCVRAGLHLLRRRIFTLRAWTERLRGLPRILREEVLAIGGYDQAATRYLSAAARRAHADRRPQPRAALSRAAEREAVVNTGTWMKMINLDLQYLGQDSGLTYALIEYPEDGGVRRVCCAGPERTGHAKSFPTRTESVRCSGWPRSARRAGQAHAGRARRRSSRIAPPATLTAGTPALIEVFVRLPPGPEQPCCSRRAARAKPCA